MIVPDVDAPIKDEFSFKSNLSLEEMYLYT